jgi:16S rRNA (adenine1518-N6/adenine1519-N6)-dimethyltransferase
MYSPLATPTNTKAFLREQGLYTKKRLGQHFLIDDAIVGKILKLAALSPADCVLEVGPGIGTLTLAVLPQVARLIAVEKDWELVAALRESIRDSRLCLHAADALDLDLETLELPPTALVANLPYQIAATFVLAAFERLPSLRQATVMVQREVAERMQAACGTKAYGAYTVKLRLLARPVGGFSVARTSFLPPPHVDSRVIRIERLAGVDALASSFEQYQALSLLIDVSFHQRRKMLRNNLCLCYPRSLLQAAFEQAGIEPSARAEMLTPADFVRLGDALGVLH